VLTTGTSFLQQDVLVCGDKLAKIPLLHNNAF